MAASSQVNQELIESLVTLFSSFLSSEWTRKRAPYRLRESIQSTRSSPPDSSSRIFLDRGGFKAWLAYFFATTGEAHFSGRQARQQLIAELHKLPVEERARIAQRVTASDIHPSAEVLFRSMEQQTVDTQAVGFDTVGPKRRRQDESPTRYDEYPISPPHSTLPTSNQPRGESCSTHIDRSQTYTDSVLAEEQGQVVTGASIQGLLNLFPEYISGAIRRDGAADQMTAAVMMNFPRRSFGDVACIMTLVVLANKVERLAMLLFGAHLESDGGIREVVLQDGARLIPSPQVILQGSHSDAVSKVFGSETAGAIAAAPFRRREILEGTRATRCVTMTIFRESDKTALITLTLGLREGFQIHDKLYT
ncbi:hypothetical protein BKA56DRAFT_604803 [Ilyonectria sp. MPI-CAGE-AT-0026]|nr:hypothetical protein BKA56DRAFT_604803 [Ilyonectria sp. MPI-CAGE-AT-0026]